MTYDTYPELQLWVNGRWLGADGRDCEPVLNPATGNVLGQLPHAKPQDIDAALEGAKKGFQVWRKTSPFERSRLLRKTAEIIRAKRDALATLISLELGKPFSAAGGEANTAAEMFEWAAEECRRSYGRVIPARSPGYRMMAVPEPVGPVAAFSGWNAPAITPSRKISGALGAGCSIIIKPAEATPAVALFIARALEDAGLPEGVVNVVFGAPADVANQLLRSQTIRLVTFTGSVSVGKQLAALSAQTMKHTVFELGGHAPALIFPDVDVDEVVAGAVATKFRNSGQVCTSPTRFYVHQAIYARFVEKFVELARNWSVGDPFSDASKMGPLQNMRRVTAMLEMVDDAVNKNATLAAGGNRIGEYGFFFEPTVLTDVSSLCRAANEEPFGPLALITPFGTVEDAIDEANRLPVGLASYAFTNDLHTAEYVSNEINCGNVIINHWKVSYPETPFGGVQDSGIGREGGIEGLQAFQQLKFISQAS